MKPASELGRFPLILASTLVATVLSALLSIAGCADDDASRSEAQSKSRDAGAGMDASREPATDAAPQKSEAAKPDGEQPDDKAKSDEQEAEAKGDKAASNEAQSEGPADFCGVMNLMQNKCQACHGATLAAGAPMSLVTYADFVAPAKSDPARKVYELVKERTHDDKKPMPPRGMLSSSELAPLDAWLNAGAPHAAALCKPVDFMRAKPDESWPKDCEDIYTITAHDQKTQRLMNRLWTKIKTGR